MSWNDIARWQAYFQERPVGWRDDDRTYKLMQAWGVKQPAHTIFASLAAFKEAQQARSSPADSLKGSLFFQKMLTAVGGDTIHL